MSYYHTINLDNQEIFYREAGPKDAPTLLLLHGFPISSYMFRNLLPALSYRFHVIVPDFPGFGNSAMPSADKFDYTFDHLADVTEQFVEKLNLNRYNLYLMDYGAPVGFRLAVRHPERVNSLIVQNGNAYEEGLRKFWAPIRKYWKDRTPDNAKALAGLIAPDGVQWQYTHGVRNETAISPDNWNLDLRRLTPKGNPDIQLALFYDYQNNIPHYPAWQTYFRKHQPPTLIVCGKNDYIFTVKGAHPYKRDLKNIKFQSLDAGHFVLEEDGDVIAGYIRDFLSRTVSSNESMAA